MSITFSTYISPITNDVNEHFLAYSVISFSFTVYIFEKFAYLSKPFLLFPFYLSCSLIIHNFNSILSLLSYGILILGTMYHHGGVSSCLHVLGKIIMCTFKIFQKTRLLLQEYLHM